jgi:hypothetical protein
MQEVNVEQVKETLDPNDFVADVNNIGSYENKGTKKMLKLSEKICSALNHVLVSERNSIRKKLDFTLTAVNDNTTKFIEGVNKDLDIFKKKYMSIYSDLVSRVLLKMETRVFNAEIFQQAAIDLIVKRLYEIEVKLSNGTFMTYEEYVNKASLDHRELQQSIVDKIAASMKQAEENKNEPIQEEKTDSVNEGTENSEGTEDNKDNSGTSSSKDNQES